MRKLLLLLLLVSPLSHATTYEIHTPLVFSGDPQYGEGLSDTSVDGTFTTDVNNRVTAWDMHIGGKDTVGAFWLSNANPICTEEFRSCNARYYPDQGYALETSQGSPGSVISLVLTDHSTTFDYYYGLLRFASPVGYSVVSASAVPEPNVWLGIALAGGWIVLRRRGLI